ncbi:hypothetical protein B0H19DRAFT_1082013 [Mycena capillaripes]|nr:hypothetical protein B0H19DRAFT_1082013 [Mycena capillaripes]
MQYTVIGARLGNSRDPGIGKVEETGIAAMELGHSIQPAPEPYRHIRHPKGMKSGDSEGRGVGACEFGSESGGSGRRLAGNSGRESAVSFFVPVEEAGRKDGNKRKRRQARRGVGVEYNLKSDDCGFGWILAEVPTDRLVDWNIKSRARGWRRLRGRQPDMSRTDTK